MTFPLIPWRRLVDADGWQIGSRCEHLTDATAWSGPAWQRWVDDGYGDPQLVAVCEQCYRELRRWRHQRRAARRPELVHPADYATRSQRQ